MKTVTIIETTVISSGTSNSGTPWTLREVTALDEAGAPIELKLKTFDELSGTVQVDVERQDDPKYGTSYMLKLPRGTQGANPAPAGARLGPKVDAVQDRLAALEARVDALEVARTSDGRSYGTPPPTTGATF